LFEKSIARPAALVNRTEQTFAFSAKCTRKAPAIWSGLQIFFGYSSGANRASIGTPSVWARPATPKSVAVRMRTKKATLVYKKIEGDYVDTLTDYRIYRKFLARVACHDTDNLD